MLAKLFKVLIVLACFTFIPVVQAYQNPGQPTGYVNDFANVLSVDQKQTLETKLTQFEKDTSNEISVVFIKDLGGDTIENYAASLFKDWGIGKQAKDNGVLVLVAMTDHQMRLEVGYGLEGALTDAQSNWIINNIMQPAFRQNDYYGGVNSAVDKIIAATQGEYVPSSSNNKTNSNIYQGLFFFGIYFFIFLASWLGRSKSWWLGGVIGGVAGVIISLFVGFLYYGIISIVVLIPLGLLFDWFVSRKYQASKLMGVFPWWLGGGRGGKGGGFGGGGFGGFGGGGSGGGGSSGGW